MSAIVEGFNLAVTKFWPSMSIFSDPQVWSAIWIALFIFGGFLMIGIVCVLLIYWDIKKNGR